MKNRLDGLSSSEAVSSVNASHSGNPTSELNREFSISASDRHYILLKDTVDQYTKHTSLVQVSSASLEKVGDYLVQIQAKVSQLESSLQTDPLRVQLSSELATLENELSAYLGALLKAPLRKVSMYNFSSESETKFFNEILSKGNFSNAEAQSAEIEVNFAHGVAEAIKLTTRYLPICMARADTDASGIAQGITNGIDSSTNSNPLPLGQRKITLL